SREYNLKDSLYRRCNVMDDKNLILSALSLAPPKTSRKKVLKSFDTDPLVRESIFIPRSTKKKRRDGRSRPVSEWSNTDFLNHYRDALSVRGLFMERRGLRNAEVMSKIYDVFVTLNPDTNNALLKEYIDWWSAIHSMRYVGQEM